MKWLLLVLVPAAFAGGIIVGRKTVSQKAPEVATPVPAAAPVAPPPAMIERNAQDADALAQLALEAYVKGQYRVSVTRCREALKIDAEHPLAWRILGGVQCKLKNRDGAR